MTEFVHDTRLYHLRQATCSLCRTVGESDGNNPWGFETPMKCG